MSTKREFLIELFTAGNASQFTYDSDQGLFMVGDYAVKPVDLKP